MADVERVLKPANENPWYVLMTLYGERGQAGTSPGTFKKNCAAWNAWMCQGMPAEEQEALFSKEQLFEYRAWDGMREEVLGLHEVEMLSRNGIGFVYGGIPDTPFHFDFSDVEFPHTFGVEGMVIYGHAFFNRAIFFQHASFVATVFCGCAQFNSATFSDMAGFHSAQFFENAEFSRSTFNGSVQFDNSKFYDSADFTSATLAGDTSFNLTTFCSETKFISTTFEREAAFRAAKFRGRTRFVDTAYKGFAQFPEAWFGVENEKIEVEFTDCQFFKPTNFRMAKFLSQYPQFAGTVLHEKTTFTDQTGHWPKDALGDPEQAKASCAVIRNSLGKQGLPEAEHFFFRREMGFAGQIGGWWQQLPYRFFGWISDYGYSIERPLFGLFALWIFPALVFLNASRTCYCIEDVYQHSLSAMALSFSNVFNFLGFQKIFLQTTFMQDLDPWMKFWSGFQMIMGVVLLFFLGLGLRTRFRMR